MYQKSTAENIFNQTINKINEKKYYLNDNEVNCIFHSISHKKTISIEEEEDFPLKIHLGKHGNTKDSICIDTEIVLDNNK